MSPSEEITSEVRRVVQACRSLEAQLQQSIPKKDHEQEVARLQSSVDSATADYDRAKSELENTTSIGQRMVVLESQIASQNEAVSSQARAFESFTVKLAESSVPFSAYTEAVSKSHALEARVSSMVEANEFAAAQTKIAELEDRIANMVPRAQYSSVELELAQSVPLQKYEDLLRNFEQMVPRDQLNVAEGKIIELERALANSVPRQDFEDLTGRIAQITREAAELVGRPSISQAVPEGRIETPSAPEVVTATDTPALETFASVEPEQATPAEEVTVAVVNTAEEFVLQTEPQADIPQDPTPTVEVTSFATPEVVQTAPAPEPEIVAVVEPIAPVQVEVPAAQPEPTPELAPVESVTVAVPPPREEANTPEQNPAPAEVQPTSVEVETAVPEVPQIVEEAAPAVEAPQSPAEPQVPAAAVTEITEVQSSLAEINTEIETGVTAAPLSPIIVGSERGFRFSNTEYCAKSGMEFLEDVEKIDISVIASHIQNGDFERWFQDVLVDETSAHSLKIVRESNVSGEELRTMLVAAIAPRYRT